MNKRVVLIFNNPIPDPRSRILSRINPRSQIILRIIIHDRRSGIGLLKTMKGDWEGDGVRGEENSREGLEE